MQTTKTHHFCIGLFVLTVAIAVSACSAKKPRASQIKVSIDIDNRGTFHCPVVSGITALPLEAHVGFALVLEGFTTASIDDASVRWSGIGGTFSTPRAFKTGFTCVYAGDHTLSFKVSKTGCPDSTLKAVVTCTAAHLGTAGAGG